VLFFPKGFDLAGRGDSDRYLDDDLDRTSIMDAPWYRDAAIKEGWVVLATDTAIRPRAGLTSMAIGRS